MPTAPNSFTSTAHFSPSGLAARMRWMLVVLPTPNAPVIMLQGTGLRAMAVCRDKGCGGSRSF